MKPLRPGSQTSRLFDRLEQGPVTNIEVVHKMRIIRMSGRVAELRKRGNDILATPVQDRRGVFVYQLVR